MLEYKGYIAKVELDPEADTFHGQVINTRDVIHFTGTTPAELKQALRDSVEDYLAWCAEDGINPDKPFSGNFILRLDPAEHRQVAAAARLASVSINSFAKGSLMAAVQRVLSSPAAESTPEVTRSRKTARTVRTVHTRREVAPVATEVRRA